MANGNNERLTYERKLNSDMCRYTVLHKKRTDINFCLRQSKQSQYTALQLSLEDLGLLK